MSFGIKSSPVALLRVVRNFLLKKIKLPTVPCAPCRPSQSKSTKSSTVPCSPKTKETSNEGNPTTDNECTKKIQSQYKPPPLPQWECPPPCECQPPSERTSPCQGQNQASSNYCKPIKCQNTDPSSNVPGLSSNVLCVPSEPVGPGASVGGVYKNPEYFSYNKFSYYEAIIEMDGCRCPQPSAIPKISKKCDC